MTQTDDNATRWRDLAGELTERERAALERLECESQGRVPAAVLVKLARGAVEERLADTFYCDVRAPADATWVGAWERNLRLDGWSRGLVWREFRGPGMCVAIDGGQQCDGTVVRGISVYLNDDDLGFTSVEARRLAALLVAAADELDRLR